MKKILITLFVIMPIAMAAAKEENLGDILERYKEERRITEDEFTELYKAWQRDVAFLKQKYLSEKEKTKIIKIEGSSTLESSQTSGGFLPKKTESNQSR